MAGLDPAIHAFVPQAKKEDVDARIKSGHDGPWAWRVFAEQRRKSDLNCREKSANAVAKSENRRDPPPPRN
jgi:hypothetical protein